MTGGGKQDTTVSSRLNREILADFPKVELHRHLEGSFPAARLYELSLKNKLPLPHDFGAFKKEIQFPEDSSPDFLTFLTKFKNDWYDSLEDVSFITYHSVRELARDGIFFIELRFAPPFISAGKELGNDEIIEAVLDGITRGMNRYPIQVGLIGILVRTMDLEINRLAAAELNRYAGSRHRNADRICGFDLANAEDRTDPEDFLPMVQQAREAGLGITIHSGENTSAAAVRRTLDLFAPERIGHGINSWGDEALLKRIRDEEVMLEVCPTSNWLTSSVSSLEEHPLPHLYRSEIPVSINSDDPNLFGIDLVHEYQLCARLYGFTEADFMSINRQTVEHSFLPRELRSEILRRHFPPAD